MTEPISDSDSLIGIQFVGGQRYRPGGISAFSLTEHLTVMRHGQCLYIGVPGVRYRPDVSSRRPPLSALLAAEILPQFSPLPRID